MQPAHSIRIVLPTLRKEVDYDRGRVKMGENRMGA